MTIIQLSWTHLFETDNEGKCTFSLPVSMGRDPQNDLVLKSRYGYVSRRHAQIELIDGQLILRDCHSTNGLFVNNNQVTQSVLAHDDSFAVGAYEITLKVMTQCNNSVCQKHVDSALQMCPWCGRFLADTVTKEPLFI